MSGVKMRGAVRWLDGNEQAEFIYPNKQKGNKYGACKYNK